MYFAQNFHSLHIISIIYTLFYPIILPWRYLYPNKEDLGDKKYWHN